MDSIRRSYRIGNQMRLPKQMLDIGHTTVGIHVSISKSDTTAMHIIVFQLPRGAKRSCRNARISVSIPKTSVMNPTRKMAVMVREYFGGLKKMKPTRKCNRC